MTESQKAIFVKTTLIAIDSVKKTRDDLKAKGQFTLAAKLNQTLSDIQALYQELIPSRTNAEPCVYVQKMRTFAPNESFDRWCIKHNHWLNDAPAKKLADTL